MGLTTSAVVRIRRNANLKPFTASGTSCCVGSMLYTVVHNLYACCFAIPLCIDLMNVFCWELITGTFHLCSQMPFAANPSHHWQWEYLDGDTDNGRSDYLNSVSITASTTPCTSTFLTANTAV